MSYRPEKLTDSNGRQRALKHALDVVSIQSNTYDAVFIFVD